MATNTFSLHFVLKKDKVNKQGLAPIYSKIRLNGVKMEISTTRNVHLNSWNKKKERASSNSEEYIQLNQHLDSFKTKMYATYSKLLQMDLPVSADTFKQLLKGEPFQKKKYYLIEVATEHNIQFEKLLERKYSYGSYKNYKTTLKYLIEFIPVSYKKKDILLEEVNYKFCEEYFYWLTTIKNCRTNGANKQIQRVKKILNYSMRNGYIQYNPCASYSLEFKPYQKIALDFSEIRRLASLDLKRDTLKLVKDLFLFQCFTGLSYADLYRLRREHIVSTGEGKSWIKMERQKTSISFSIPLLEPAKKILNHYMDFLNQDSINVFKVLTNQKMNQNLKIIQELAGISKNLTTHLARHTFATTITLSNGVPIETVSKMLGHTKLSTTQLYAKVLDNKIGEDMKMLANRLESLN